jgi:hypothetical protein
VGGMFCKMGLMNGYTKSILAGSRIFDPHHTNIISTNNIATGMVCG